MWCRRAMGQEDRGTTTIAWDGTTLAGDTLGVVGQSLKVEAHKIFQLPDGRLFGGSGVYDAVLAVREWLTNGGDKPTVPEFAGIIIDTTGHCARLEEALVYMPIYERFHAVGSGRDFAITAMSLGHDARSAVQVAAQWDVWTGGDIETLTLGEDMPAEGSIVWLHQASKLTG